MNRRGKTNIKSIVMASIVFSMLLLSIVTFLTSFMNEYDSTAPSEFETLNNMADSHEELTDNVTSMNENRNFFQKVGDAITDSWIGQSFKVGFMISESFGVFTKYVTELSSVLGIKSEVIDAIIPTIMTLITISIIFTGIYFIRSAK